MLVLQDSEEHVALHEGLYGVCRLLFIFTFWWGIQGRTGVKYNSSTDDKGVLKKTQIYTHAHNCTLRYTHKHNHA